MLTPLRRIVHQRVAQTGVGRQIQAARLLAQCQKHLADLVDPKVASRARAAVYRNGNVTVTVPSAVVAQELVPILHELTIRLRQSFPELPIERIMTRVVTAQ